MHYSSKQSGRAHNHLFGLKVKRYFFKKLRKNTVEAPILRPGALFPDVLKKEIQNIGVGKIVELIRIGYDGKIDDIPIIVQILGIYDETFTGKIINVEREIIEQTSGNQVYARRGGGIIEFRFDDGDVKDVILSKDIDEMNESRNIGGLQDIISTLDIDDRILVAYFDRVHKGMVNVEGRLGFKFAGSKKFQIIIDKINGIELDKTMEKQFDIEADIVFNVSIV